MALASASSLLCFRLLDTQHIAPLDYQLSILTNSQHLNISNSATPALSSCCSSYSHLSSAANTACCLDNCFDHLMANCRCSSSFELVTVSFVQIASPVLETCWTALTGLFRHLCRLDAGRSRSLLHRLCFALGAHLPCFCRKHQFRDFHQMARTMFPSVFSHYFWEFDLGSSSSLGLRFQYQWPSCHFDSQHQHQLQPQPPSCSRSTSQPAFEFCPETACRKILSAASTADLAYQIGYLLVSYHLCHQTLHLLALGPRELCVYVGWTISWTSPFD